MVRRLNRKVLWALIISLLALNVLRWLYSSTEGGPTIAHRGSSALRADDFTIVGMTPDDTGVTIKRDLFQPKAAPKPVVIKKAEIKPPEPPPKTPEQIEEEAARTELGQIKCVAVSFRNQRWQAFLTEGDQVFLVGVGDKVGHRFVVDNIVTDGVYISDPKSRVSGQLPVTGG